MKNVMSQEKSFGLTSSISIIVETEVLLLAAETMVAIMGCTDIVKSNKASEMEKEFIP